ncbi:MAG: hypothetical protein V7L25_18815, partial [Nostoc sp.]|uniref:hypothetical protein n=1 Tax=Nostoc sp. TaxID=1180 RepID=UPI002FEE9F79
ITVGSSHLNLSRNSRNTYSLCPNVIGYGYNYSKPLPSGGGIEHWSTHLNFFCYSYLGKRVMLG